MDDLIRKYDLLNFTWEETGKESIFMEKNEEYQISHESTSPNGFTVIFFFKLWRNKQFQCYLHAPRKLREGGPVLFISIRPFLWSPVFPVFQGSRSRALLVGLWLVLPGAGTSARLGRKRNGEAKSYFWQSWLVRAGAGRLMRDSDEGGGECLEPEWPQQMSGYSSFWGFNCLM